MTAPDISHLIDSSDAGSWADALQYGVNIKVSESVRKDGGRRGEPSPFVAPTAKFSVFPHNSPSRAGSEHNHGS